jgi:hypothetical protein
VLAKWQAALQLAMQQGWENPVDRAIRILETALNDIIIIVEETADEEEWPLARRQEQLQEIGDPVQNLISSARDIRQDTAVAAPVTQVCTLPDEVAESARQVIDDRAPNSLWTTWTRSCSWWPSTVSGCRNYLLLAKRLAMPAILSSKNAADCTRGC